MTSQSESEQAGVIVAAAWASLLEKDLSEYPGDLAQLVGVAEKSRQLKSLFPFLSVGRLCFSQCTEYPYFVPLWIAPLGNGIFSVQRPSSPGGWVDGIEVVRGPAVDAVREADLALRRDAGNVVVGDAESLGLL